MQSGSLIGPTIVGVEEKIGRVERLLRRLEEDQPYLHARFSKLGAEHRASGYAFAERVRLAAEAELQRLLTERNLHREEGLMARWNDERPRAASA